MGGAADDDKELRAELVANFHIDAQAVEQIFELMQKTDLRFSDAALKLGLVTREDIEQALIRTRGRKAPGESGLIENAIRRISSDKRIVLRHGEAVAPGPSLILVTMRTIHAARSCGPCARSCCCSTKGPAARTSWRW
jgi:hypothetical protein